MPRAKHNFTFYFCSASDRLVGCVNALDFVETLTDWSSFWMAVLLGNTKVLLGTCFSSGDNPPCVECIYCFVDSVRCHYCRSLKRRDHWSSGGG